LGYELLKVKNNGLKMVFWFVWALINTAVMFQMTQKAENFISS
jgi:hypothetical protein